MHIMLKSGVELPIPISQWEYSSEKEWDKSAPGEKEKKCQDIFETWHRGIEVSELSMFFLLEM